ncbi:MAG: GNAT family N-acetyltransferase [Solidesulfovibrio sp.]
MSEKTIVEEHRRSGKDGCEKRLHHAGEGDCSSLSDAGDLPSVGRQGADRHVTLLSAVECREQALFIWSEFCQSCQHAYYISPGWIETWIDCIGDQVVPYLLLVHENNVPICACFVTYTNKRRGRIFSSRTINFFSSGAYEVDMVGAIYNAFLCKNNFVYGVDELFRLVPLEWDEAFMPGLCPSCFPGSTIAACDQRWVIYDYNKSLCFIDISKFGTSLDSYLALLSQNTRSQIRRTFRLYAQGGDVQIRAAASVEEALNMAEELYRLCCIRKSDKNMMCSINTYFRKFNKALIKSRFDKNEIQFLHIYNDAGTIGYLYNHVYNGIVYNYQGGFIYTDDNRLKPGLVAHVEAIMYNARLGNKKYDFGAGNERYKKSLSTGQGNMQWVRLLRPSLKMKVFKGLKGLLENVRARLSA